MVLVVVVVIVMVVGVVAAIVVVVVVVVVAVVDEAKRVSAQHRTSYSAVPWLWQIGRSLSLELPNAM